MVILKIFWCKYKAKSDLRGGPPYPPFYIHMPYRLDKSRSAKSSLATKNLCLSITKWPPMHMLTGTKNGPQLVIDSVNILWYVCDHVFVDTFDK